MKKINFTLLAILLVGTLYHAAFLHLNEVMKIADSFAYLQMSHFLQSHSQEGLGNGWFGFVYSLPIAFLNIFIGNDFLTAKIINLILFNISAILLWNISRKILSVNYSYLVVILFFLSPTLLHFNIHVLSENIYIPLFLGLFLTVWDFVTHVGAPLVGGLNNPGTHKGYPYKYIIMIACLLGLMYLTRAEAFIYIGSIGIISLGLLFQKKLSFAKFLGYGALFFVTFFLFISPYLFHLHSITGEWGLTNKGASNLRQAELRGQDKMDDAGFEQAVAELTSDKHHLIAGFAGGMPYDAPQIEGSLGEFITQDPLAFTYRVITNQKKLFTRNLPEIFLGKSPKLYTSDDARFSHIFFLIWILLPLGTLVFGIIKLYQKQKIFFSLSLIFFVPALIFFTLFFTLNRYFLIFLPLLLIAFVYGTSSIKNNYLKIFFIGNFISILLLSTLVYYNIESPKDDYYALKQEAGEWLISECRGTPCGYPQNIESSSTLGYPQGVPLQIMERFPIVTYYADSKTRYITPYTKKIQDIYEYGNYNNIDILVVDTMDFETYRPSLKKFLEETPENFTKLKQFQNKNQQKVILYQLKK